MLRANDPTAAQVVRLWAAMNDGNQPPDKCAEAMHCADVMEKWHGLNAPQTAESVGYARDEIRDPVRAASLHDPRQVRMICPHCGAATRVIETRTREGADHRRRRQCEGPEHHRFNTLEVWRDEITDMRRRAFQFERLRALLAEDMPVAP